MKKRALAILMILVLATAGLFAEGEITIATPDNVKATLTATIGEYLMHGFTVGTAKYQPTVTIENAFGTTAPSFRYGYKTNAAGTFVITMSVGNFINQTTTGTVKIGSVTSNKTISDYAVTGYKIFDTSTIIEGERTEEAIITVYPAKTTDGTTTDHASVVIAANEIVTGAPAGVYVSEITFAISAS